MSHGKTQPLPNFVPISLSKIPGAHGYFSTQKDALYQMWAHQDILSEKTPSGATDTGVKGTLVRDDTYLYYCSDTDTWLRATIASLFTTW